MKTPLESVKEFHRAFGQPVLDAPALPELTGDTVTTKAALLNAQYTLKNTEQYLKNIPNPDQRIIRMRLLIEEFVEYLNAEIDNDIVEIADALADLQYIGNGTAAAYGIPLDDIFNEVHENNMTKLGPDGKPIVVNGKIQKPAHYKPVDLRKFFPE